MRPEIKMKVENRLEYNLKILDKLRELCIESPQLRLVQLLYASNLLESNGSEEKMILIRDRFYEEPWDTLDRIN